MLSVLLNWQGLLLGAVESIRLVGAAVCPLFKRGGADLGARGGVEGSGVGWSKKQTLGKEGDGESEILRLPTVHFPIALRVPPCPQQASLFAFLMVMVMAMAFEVF